MSLSSRVALLSTAVLVACGGGGDGGSAPPPPPPAPAGYSVSGQVRVADNTLVDSDVNDTLAPHAPNNGFATAQALPNPASLGGYANTPGEGPAGRSRAAGDEDDVFRINGVAGQRVSLIVADPRAGDLDLYLYDAAQTEVAHSVGTGTLEGVTIPATGSYFVRVNAYDGASNYVLTVGQPAATGTPEGDGRLLSSDDFVPGEMIVRWRPSAGNRASAMSAHGVSRKAGIDGADWLVSIDDPARALQNERARALSGSRTAGPLSTQDLKAATLQAIKRMRSDPAVAYAEPNFIRRAHATPTDPYYRLQWHYPLINLPQAWDITTGSNSVSVAVIDTGVLLNHPDLQGRLLPGYDFISDTASARDGNGIDNNPDDPGDNNTPGGSSSFHGTHVAGTIAAASNGTVGVAGIGWGIRIMPLRVLGAGGGTSYDIMQAMLYAAGLDNDSRTLPAQRVDIINLSLGGGGVSQAEQNVFNQVRAQGVAIVASAGNEATTALSYPASYDGVISVSSVGIRKTLASYSNSGSRVDVAAPGGDPGDVNGDGYSDEVLSTAGDDSTGQIRYGYAFKSGTSMAAPHVSGVLALMKSVAPGLSPDTIDTLLAAGRLTVDIGTPGRDDNYGHGLIDALKAVQAAQNIGGTAPPLLATAPAALNFAPGITTQSLTVGNGGGGTLQVTTVQVTPASAWITVTPPAAANGLGTYTVTVNRGTLAPGAYSTSLRIVSNANTVSVPVTLQVAAAGTTVSPNLGEQYVLLVDPVSLDARYQVQARVNNGVYNFQFNGVAAGTYLLVTGSDADNNGSICDLAEACGAYLSMDDPARVTVNTNRSGLNFNAGYVTSISAAGVGGWNSPVRGTKRLTAVAP